MPPQAPVTMTVPHVDIIQDTALRETIVAYWQGGPADTIPCVGGGAIAREIQRTYTCECGRRPRLEGVH
jgi:hypothetical protein